MPDTEPGQFAAGYRDSAEATEDAATSECCAIDPPEGAELMISRRSIACAFAVAFLLGSVYATDATASCEDPPHRKVDWSGCQKLALFLRGADLREAQFDGADLSRTALMDASLVGATLVKANISRRSEEH